MQYVSNFVGAGLAAILFDILVETLDVDFLNRTPIVNADGTAKSNYELMVDIFGFILAGGGAMSVITGKRVLGMGPDEFFTGTGAVMGKNQYESWLARALGLRQDVEVTA